MGSSRFTDLRFERRVAAGTGAAFELAGREGIEIVDLAGRQICAMVALKRDEPTEYLSAAHTREALGSVMLSKRALLVSNRWDRLLRLDEDTVGRHDLTQPACGARGYRDRDGSRDHPNCRDNLAAALQPYGMRADRLPDPVNLFMHAAILGRGNVEIREPLSEAGDSVLFRALVDLVVAVSACPQDRDATNGFTPTDLLVRVYYEHD